jgi:hypothetical protein
MARVEHDVVEDQILESDVGETAVDVDHVLDRLIELDVRVTDIHQRRGFQFEVLTFQIFDVFREP